MCALRYHWKKIGAVLNSMQIETFKVFVLILGANTAKKLGLQWF